MSVTVGILVFDGVDELDFVGPLDVLGAAGWGRDDTKVLTVGRRRGPMQGVNGLHFTANHDFSDTPHLDVVVVPGGLGATEAAQDQPTLEWLRKSAASAQWVCSVCTGSFILQAAGLTQARRITTHSGAISLLRSTGPGDVIEGQRYVIDGNLVTAAGVSAGIDMSLWLVGEIYGAEHARTVRRLLDYDPAPPY